MLIALLVAVAFFFGWSAFRYTGKRPPSVPEPLAAAPALSEPPGPASTNSSSAESKAAPKDPRLSAIADITERRDQQIAEIRDRAKGFETEDDRRAIAKIQQESDAQIKALLSDNENQALQVEQFKQSDLGKGLIEHYAPSDTELAAISDYEKAIADVVATGGDLEGVNTASLQRLERILGEERLKEFMNYRDPEFLEKLNFVKRFNLPPKTAMDLAQLQAEHGKFMLETIKQGQYRPDPNLKEKFRSRVKQLLGAEAAEVYIREAKSALWLR
jgi:hypothetical protein